MVTWMAKERRKDSSWLEKESGEGEKGIVESSFPSVHPTDLDLLRRLRQCSCRSVTAN